MTNFFRKNSTGSVVLLHLQRLFKGVMAAMMLYALCGTPCLLAATQWQTLTRGIDYTNIPLNNTGGSIHAFKIDLNDYRLSLARAQDGGDKSANVAQLALQNQGIIAINGGFFDPFDNPLGLRIEKGQLLNSLRPISWWGVFYVLNNHRAYIDSQRDFTLAPNIDFAIQSGPRLIINGRIPPLKDSFDARSALCINKPGNVIIAITQNAAPTPTQFAQLLQRPTTKNGLGCYNALNLDGGSSSQLYANVNGFQLLIPSFNNVADGVVVVPLQILRK